MSRATGPRVVKGRSVKQQAASKRYAAAIAGQVAGALAPSAPASSWWVGLDRQQLREQVEVQRNRMALSRRGRLKTGTE
jgi:hypothetical protein